MQLTLSEENHYLKKIKGLKVVFRPKQAEISDPLFYSQNIVLDVTNQGK